MNNKKRTIAEEIKDRLVRGEYKRVKTAESGKVRNKGKKFRIEELYDFPCEEEKIKVMEREKIVKCVEKSEELVRNLSDFTFQTYSLTQGRVRKYIYNPNLQSKEHLKSYGEVKILRRRSKFFK